MQIPKVLYVLLNVMFHLSLLGAFEEGSFTPGDDDFGKQHSYILEHSLTGEDSDFQVRGQLVIHSLKPLTTSSHSSISEAATLVQNRLSEVDINILKKQSEVNGLYRVRLSLGPSSYVSTHLPVCAMLESHFSDILRVTVDSDGNILGIWEVTNVEYCSIDSHFETQNRFNTTLEIHMLEPGPTPDTASYLQKLEEDKMARERGDGKEQKSFFAKYWMYIIPVVIILMMSGGGGASEDRR
ncbi:unnamed protein product [Darwinula stevensoni]|uniref:ER membrane protein complex subunit 10 n=1 Tax=Darwinula stevensoni TaxID=69355 RepID=A0A7R8X8E9_9CRUS|nr:unnamed protein product [Darwinula stevensoni]CAG0890041.1 unnamed protein product [Darwinula stevensoni]